MKNRSYLLNVLLAAVLGAVMLLALLVKTFLPGVILPRLDIPNVTALCLVVFLIDAFVSKNADRNYILIFVFAVLTFGILPLAAGALGHGWVLALVGGAVFTAATWLMDSAKRRIFSGNGSRLALVLTALGIYLAVQSFSGIIL